MVRQIIKTQTDGFRKRTTNKLNWRNQLQRTQKWPLNNTKQQQQKKEKQRNKQNKYEKRQQQKRNKEKKTDTQKNKNINKK